MAEWIIAPISGMVEGMKSLFHGTPPLSPLLSDISSLNVDLQSIERTLPQIETVLVAVREREKQLREVMDASVKRWLREINDVAHDAEDVLDKYKYELHRSLMEDDGHDAECEHCDRDGDIDEVEGQTKVCIPPVTPSLLDASVLKDIAHSVRTIRERLDGIDKQKQGLDLPAPKEPRSVRKCSTNLIPRHPLYGREKIREEVKRSLLHIDDEEPEYVSVIALVGMAGIGKTVLAQLLYTDDTVRRHFDARGWIHVTPNFDLVNITIAIVESVTRMPCNNSNLDSLQHTLIQELQGKRFFLVLDDVWNESLAAWDKLLDPLRVGSKGSRILVTTRNGRVADITRPSATHTLSNLSDDDAWQLFAQHAFKNHRGPPILRRIGRDIVKKCKGSPLTVKVLACLLRDNEDVVAWNEILESGIWKKGDSRHEILAPLRLSYNYLPPHLKYCFLHSAVYPRDHHFDKHELVQIWMAHGLIRGRISYLEPERTGMRYFDSLLERSFFLPIQTTMGESRFVMHDLMHDLALYILEEDRSDELSTAHLPLLPLDFRTSKSPVYHEYRTGRAFLSVWYPGIQVKLEILHAHLKYLRSLDLSGSRIEQLPDSVGNLIHLRYLGLRDTSIKFLPESVCKLYLIQTLDLRDCSLPKLPDGIGKLRNLRHLLTEECIFMPIGIGRLTNLNTLAWFDVRREGDYCGVIELADLDSLRGEFRVSGLGNVIRAEEAQAAGLNTKRHLYKLMLDWRPCGNEIVPEFAGQEKEQVVENLIPHAYLEDLRIDSYNGFQFPLWLGHESFYKLTKVVLSYCENCKVLPGLGNLPKLKVVEIEGLLSLKHVGADFHGVDPATAFQSLEELAFRCMENLEDWYGPSGVNGGGFPQLRKLELCKCPVLFKKQRQAKRPHYPSVLEQPPPTLQYLYIQDCSFLRRWCRRHARTKLASIQNVVLSCEEFR